MLDLLDRHGAQATFFCIGDLARRHPRLVEAIVARGHAVENHSQRHWHNFSLLGPGALRREIEAAQDTLTGLSGMQPLFFRAPAGLRNPFLEPVLCRLGLQLASWTRRGFDTRTRDAAVVTRRLLRGLARATSCSSMTAMPHAARKASRSSWKCCRPYCARRRMRGCSAQRCAPRSRRNRSIRPSPPGRLIKFEKTGTQTVP